MARTNIRTSRRKYCARYLAHYTKQNHVVITLGILFVVGVGMGTLLMRSAGAETVELLERLVGGFVDKRRGGSLYENFLSAWGSSTLFVLILFVSGFCAVGQPVIVAAPFVRGLGFGFSTASLFARYGTSAIGFVGVLLLPGTLISTVAIFIGCKNALRMSGVFLSAVRPGAAREAEPHSLRNYLLGFGLSVVLCLVGAFLEAALYFLFANSFVLG